MKKYQSLIFIIGAVLLLTGAASYITHWNLSPYLYSAGALAVAVVQILNRYQGKDLIIKRLYRQQIFGALFLVITGVLMFTLPHGNEWMLTLTIAAVLELYTAFRLPQEEGSK
ncbi:hypothetical protein [uncultured Bacteroides sp.]|uniref:hypothetical protein n=1 Tax=uncultured Bacteroides sp. TaxID=162156 RepID=UPI002AAAD055|nr:hypothetical protein [uncultured Bacteroides sp.]